MVDDIQRRRIILHGLEDFHQTEDILRIIEIPRSNILDFHDHSTQAGKLFHRELDMVCQRSQLSVPRRKYLMKIAALLEYVIHIPSAFRVPAVLGAEATYKTLGEGLVKLFFQRCGSE